MKLIKKIELFTECEKDLEDQITILSNRIIEDEVRQKYVEVKLNYK
jgi:hypothetical protein